eukprot:GAHX01002791.1.p1 GENE.GAHX01002791.1~~GAHX01002791.1.p1  ORF type:complete len:273 (+),score=49.91 GAHX01002791.1:415-1233(+)
MINRQQKIATFNFLMFYTLSALLYVEQKPPIEAMNIHNLFKLQGKHVLLETYSTPDKEAICIHILFIDLDVSSNRYLSIQLQEEVHFLESMIYTSHPSMYKARLEIYDIALFEGIISGAQYKEIFKNKVAHESNPIKSEYMFDVLLKNLITDTSPPLNKVVLTEVVLLADLILEFGVSTSGNFYSGELTSKEIYKEKYYTEYLFQHLETEKCETKSKLALKIDTNVTKNDDNAFNALVLEAGKINLKSTGNKTARVSAKNEFEKKFIEYKNY